MVDGALFFLANPPPLPPTKGTRLTLCLLEVRRDAPDSLRTISRSEDEKPTEGELVAATRTRYTLRRVDERAGLVHVHFPRIGFTLKAAPAA